MIIVIIVGKIEVRLVDVAYPPYKGDDCVLGGGMRRYTLSNVSSTKRGVASAILVEDGVQIAKITRAANYRMWGKSLHSSPLAFAFFSTQAKLRFCSWSDSISMEESAYAIGMPQPFSR